MQGDGIGHGGRLTQDNPQKAVEPDRGDELRARLAGSSTAPWHQSERTVFMLDKRDGWVALTLMRLRREAPQRGQRLGQRRQGATRSRTSRLSLVLRRSRQDR